MGLLPIFEIYTIDPEQTGYYYKKSISPTSFDLDPYWFFRDNDFGIVTRDERANTYDLNIKKDNVKAYVRTVGLRGPLMYSAWGYDICGLPVPSTGRNSLKFDNQTAYNRSKWKSGPIDLRWDELRKVWVGGPEMIEGKLISKLDAPKDIDNPTKADMTVYRGFDLKIRDESVTLYNRNPKLSLSANDYVTAVKINYEWRPVGGGGCGGSPTNKQENKMIMVLGTYDQYKDCGGPPKPPTLPTGGCTDNHFCANQYAWSQYKVCGYKYYKSTTYKSYAWASELNSSVEDCGGASANMFYPAIFEGDPGTKADPTAACDKGVRFWSGSPANGRICGCAQFPWIKKCIKSRGKFISRPDFGDPEVITPECQNLVDAMDEGGWWGVTTEWREMCLLSGGDICAWGPEDVGPFGIVLIARAITPITKPCFEGPDVFDPCFSCDGFMEFVNSVTSDKLAGCGANIYFGNPIATEDIKDIFANCSTKRYTDFTWCKSCILQVGEWIEYSCCDTNNGDGSC